MTPRTPMGESSGHQRARSRLLTTSRGLVEVAERGSGTPVLVLHGTPGGVDAADAMGCFLPSGGFHVITLSRPGYLGTPLSSGPTLDEQADLFAAVLDALGLEACAVLAWSGAGPYAYRFAVRHPQRVTALVAFAAVSLPCVDPPPSLLDRFLLGTRIGGLALSAAARWRPQEIVDGVLAAEGSLSPAARRVEVQRVLTDEDQLAFVRALTAAGSWAGRRRAGYEHDMALFEQLPGLDLDHIDAPVLLVQGGADTDVEPAHTDHAAALIQRAQRLDLADGTHLALYVHPEARAAQTAVRAFLREATSKAPVEPTEN